MLGAPGALAVQGLLESVRKPTESVTATVFGGVLLLIGLWTRATAFILSGMMAYAYFFYHAGRNLSPLINRGELAVLYSFLFLYLSAAGGGAWGADALLKRRRTTAGAGSP